MTQLDGVNLPREAQKTHSHVKQRPGRHFSLMFQNGPKSNQNDVITFDRIISRGFPLLHLIERQKLNQSVQTDLEVTYRSFAVNLKRHERENGASRGPENTFFCIMIFTIFQTFLVDFLVSKIFWRSKKKVVGGPKKSEVGG